MAIGYNPTTVTEGLIYFLDPDNYRSYSGIGNTIYNLVNSSIGGTFVGLTTAPLDSTNTKTFYLSGNNYVSAPNNIALTNNFTISIWFKLSAYNNSSIISKWFADGTDNHRCWFIGSDSSVNAVVVTFSSDGTYTNPTIKRYVVPVSLNEYTQLTITFASGTLLVYKNGVLSTVTKVLDGSFSTVFNVASRPIQIGYQFDGSAYYNLANVGVTQIYNKVLSASEILQNYNATKKRYLPEEQIVRDGLILNLDPGNRNSYPGTGNTIYDLAGFGNTGTLTNGPTFSGLNGGSIVFDGSNDSIVFSRNNILSGTQNFTIEAFIYPITTNAEHIFGNYNNGNTSGIELYLQSEKVYLWYGNTFTASISNIQKNRWYYVCATRISNTISLYINGLLDNTGTNSNSIGTNSFYTIGNGYDYNTEAFSGNISQVKIYNRALTQQEILQNYNATKNRFINVLPPVRDNLILELDAGNLSSYPGSGTTWYDLSGNNLNGTLTNGPTYSFLDSASSIVFDGTNDFINIPSSSLFNFGSGDFSVELVTYYNTSTSSDNIYRPAFMLGSGGTYLTMNKWRSGVGNGVFVDYSVAGSRYTITTTNSVPSPVVNNTITSPLYDVNGKYTHFIIRISSNVMTLYINSVSYGSVNLASRWNTNLGLRIGTDGADYMSGLIPYIKFYNRALSAAEISQNFNYYRTRYGI